MTVFLRLCKAVAALAVLLIIVALYHRGLDVDAADEAHDLQMNGDAGAGPLETAQQPGVMAEGALTNVPPNQTWRRAIDNILRDDTQVADKSLRMLELFPNLPASMQAEAAQYLVNFATDERPEPIVRALVEKRADATAQGVLLLGLLQRADHVRLPALLQIARDPQHPKSADAIKYLAFLLEEDHGAKWAAWEQAIERRLKANKL